ncbi:hypothetical protein RGQ15_15950 [Paracoccus sp. MBLB3053]|uniref:O-antigen ligase domain-containing protein n=1 Tax=Paracoccus aurantius TaxID=3073814 RepID=A0ABU2HVJ1_9RHOB|nr:hypothetical protein [Paracoccus sp. MBLB3053]MDS9469060.1 hypothetical protein [Paracoccus sp. MBLB3053]
MPLIVMLSWPAIVAFMFSRMDRQTALVWALLAGYLFLPPAFVIDLPAVPGVNKHMMAALAAGFMVFMTRDNLAPKAGPPAMGWMITALIMVNLIAPVFTAATNGDPLIEGQTYRPGLSISFTIAETIRVCCEILPFILGFALLWDARGLRVLMRTMVLGLLIYSFFMLVEVRLSPQMNVWIYGYFQHDFMQTVRYGGFRPIVFLEHPLWVASLTVLSVMAAGVIAREKPDTRNISITLYLIVMLLLCRSAGVLIQALVTLPLLILVKPATITRVALIIAVASFLYPVLRSASLFPLEGIVELANSISPERGHSLEFRFVNEEQLLQRAMERPYFGWGGEARSLFLDPDSGELAVIPDGLWVIWMGAYGIFGYSAHFLLLLMPIVVLGGALRKRRDALPPEALLLSALAMMLAVNLLDLIPNATITPLTYLFAGAVLGNARRLASETGTQQVETPGRATPVHAGLPTIL